MNIIIEVVKNEFTLEDENNFKEMIETCIADQKGFLESIKATLVKNELEEIYEKIQPHCIGEIILFYCLIIVYFEGKEKEEEIWIRRLTTLTLVHLREIILEKKFYSILNNIIASFNNNILLVSFVTSFLKYLFF